MVRLSARACCLSAQLGVFLLLAVTVAADSTDGSSPYGSGFAPDVVVNSSLPATYPPFEGGTAPNLTDFNYTATSDDADIAASTGSGLDRRDAQDFYLRIMPLGASITQGLQSTDGNGYRKWIREQLRWKGWKVNMVGSKKDGTMNDNDNEGHPGWIIDSVFGAWEGSRWMMPNLVLVNVGVNDCIQNVDPANAGARMRAMLDNIYASVPGVTVVLSTLPPNSNAPSCTQGISQQYRDLVDAYPSSQLVLADMEAFLTISDISSDGTHPNDYGYEKMASVWWDAISKVEDLISAPAAVNGIDDASTSAGSTCAKVAGNARGPIQTQKGSGYDDGGYVHSSTARGVLASGHIGKDPNAQINTDIGWHMFFAQLVTEVSVDRGAELDDWIRVYHNPANGKNDYYVRQNLGNGNFAASVMFDVDQNCDGGPRYAFADFNNDGFADFFCIGAGSQINLSLNRGGNPPRFEYVGQVVPAHDGFEATDVRIADIDGDGRADYCLIFDNGDVGCSRNGGQGDSYYWQGFSTQDGLRGVVFTGKNKGNKTGVVFGDLNGDFRTDWMFVGDTGDVDTYINQRGWGDGIVPDWTHPGITHAGMGTPGVRERINFGRIYGSGRLDYIYFKEVDDGFDMLVWENNGSGGTRRKGDGVFYCDMRGTGSDDYVWIYRDGHEAFMYANIHDPPEWGHDVSISLNVPGPRIGIHLADWNGDGRCDVLVQNKANGALTMYRNDYDASTKSLKFTNVGVVTGSATCAQGWGVGIFDRGLRLADIDGDGRADYLCIEPNGRITGWLNPSSGVVNVGQIKFSEGWDRSNMRLADVENHGRADLIHLDKYTGAATVFQNMGHTPAGGSSFTWKNRGVLYSPIDRGETMHFANFGGLGRADLHHVLPVSNRAWTYYNECGGGGNGGDDGDIVDPGLPFYETDSGGDPITGTPDFPQYPDCPRWDSYAAVDDVMNDTGVPETCVNTYLMAGLSAQLGAALDEYGQIEADDYSTKYGYYVKAIKQALPYQWDDFYHKDMDDLFTCLYMVPDGDGYTNKTGGCPPNKTPGFADGYAYNIYFQPNNNDWGPVYDKLEKSYGIDRSWIVPYSFRTVGCIPPQPCDEFGNVYMYQPISNPDLPDPGDAITKYLGQYRDLQTWIGDLAFQSSVDMFGGSEADVVEGSAMSVYSVVAAVAAMKQVADIGEKAEKAEALEIILFFLTGFLLLLPGIGEEIDAITDSVVFSRLATMASTAGDVAVNAYSISQDPSSAPMIIGSYLLGGLASRDDRSFSNAAATRRELGDDIIAKLGTDIADGVSKVKKDFKACTI